MWVRVVRCGVCYDLPAAASLVHVVQTQEAAVRCPKQSILLMSGLQCPTPMVRHMLDTSRRMAGQATGAWVTTVCMPPLSPNTVLRQVMHAGPPMQRLQTKQATEGLPSTTSLASYLQSSAVGATTTWGLSLQRRQLPSRGTQLHCTSAAG